MLKCWTYDFSFLRILYDLYKTTDNHLDLRKFNSIFYKFLSQNLSKDKENLNYFWEAWNENGQKILINNVFFLR